MEKEAITEQHRWLQQLVGDWRYESDILMGTEQRETVSGTDRVRALGDFWIISEAEGAMPGGEGTARMVMTLGFDPQKKRFTGTFISSMMSYLWYYDGELDGTGRVLTLESTGPAMSGDGATARYRDVIDISGPAERRFSSYALGEDGKWREFMTARYTRLAADAGTAGQKA
jgi:hypothetical protein